MIAMKDFLFFAMMFFLMIPNTIPADGSFASYLRKYTFFCLSIGTSNEYDGITTAPLQQGNVTLTEGIPWDIIITAVVTAGATIVGTLIGYMLTFRESRATEQRDFKRKFKRKVLAGVRALVAELEDNKEFIELNKETRNSAWNSVKQQAWFLPPIVNDQTNRQLRQVYKLLDNYNKELMRTSIINPAGLGDVLQNFIAKYDLLNNMEVAIKELRDVAGATLLELLG